MIFLFVYKKLLIFIYSITNKAIVGIVLITEVLINGTNVFNGLFDFILRQLFYWNQ